MDKAMWLCGNPLCGSMIYEHQTKYGSGTYCNKDCASEAIAYKVRCGEYKAKKEKEKKKQKYSNLSVNLIID